MDLVIRSVFLYLFLFVILRLGGNRSLAQITPFNFVLLLVVSEATQQALLGNDFSITTAIVVIVTLVGLDILFAVIKQHSQKFSTWVEGTPLVLLENGTPIQERLRRSRVDEADILEAARRQQGLERLDQIGYAVLEKSGGISVIPKRS